MTARTSTHSPHIFPPCDSRRFRSSCSSGSNKTFVSYGQQWTWISLLLFNLFTLYLFTVKVNSLGVVCFEENYFSSFLFMSPHIWYDVFSGCPLLSAALGHLAFFMHLALEIPLPSMQVTLLRLVNHLVIDLCPGKAVWPSRWVLRVGVTPLQVDKQGSVLCCQGCHPTPLPFQLQLACDCFWIASSWDNTFPSEAEQETSLIHKET